MASAVPVLVEVIRNGSPRNKENAAAGATLQWRSAASLSN